MAYEIEWDSFRVKKDRNDFFQKFNAKGLFFHLIRNGKAVPVYVSGGNEMLMSSFIDAMDAAAEINIFEVKKGHARQRKDELISASFSDNAVIVVLCSDSNEVDEFNLAIDPGFAKLRTSTELRGVGNA